MLQSDVGQCCWGLLDQVGWAAVVEDSDAQDLRIDWLGGGGIMAVMSFPQFRQLALQFLE